MAKNEHTNVKRLSTVLDAAWQIEEAQWDSLDGIILPCGFFHYEQNLASHDYETQKKLIRQAIFHDFVIEALEIVKPLSPYAYIITGIASAGDNLCVAWNRDGVASIGHEIVLRHGSTAKRLLWTYSHDSADKSKPLMTFHSQSPSWLACYGASDDGEATGEPTSADFKPVSALPASNHTGETIVIRLFEARL